MTIRTVLSALPETSRSDAGLKCRVVGGNSCAFKIVNNGYKLDISVLVRLVLKIATHRQCLRI